MVKRATIADLARASGVSVATVDRVLNGRLPVRPDTVRRVTEAAAAIGFHAAGLIQQRMRNDLPEYRLGFLLQKPTQPFYRNFAAEIETAVAGAQAFRGVAVIDYWMSQAPDDIAAKLTALSGKVDALAIVSPDHPTVNAAAEKAKGRGVPVFSLLSDCAAGIRQAYLGVDNRKVGRTAAWMIAKCARAPGKVAIFVGSHRFHGHELREIGLRSYFREHGPDFTVLDTLVNLETRQLTHHAMHDLLKRHPDLVGCYVAGGGIEGAVEALRERGPAGSPIVICNETTEVTRAALADGIVTMAIATPIKPLSRELVDVMGKAIEEPATAFADAFLPFDIHLPETI